MELTGERTLPGIDVENYWYRRHEAAYRYLVRQPYCRGAVVLEAGCGEGYGADLLAGPATRVLALDYDPASVAHAARRYPRPRLARANLAALPVAGGTVDVVACLQVIEHLWDQPGFVAECARVLRPGGRLVVTTPNRLTFSPGLAAPRNPFHTRELAPAELADLLAAAGFGPVELLGVRHGPRLRRLDGRHGGSLVAAQLAGPAESWPAGLRRDVASVRAGDFDVTTAGLDTSLDLLAVAVAPGDTGGGRR